MGMGMIMIHNRKPFIPWGVEHIRAPLAWKHSEGNQIHVAVIDTGADYTHEDLKSSLGRGVNILYRHLPPYDDNGHGTHIAGTIAAANSESGMTGVAPRAIIHPVKAFDHNGSAYISDIIQGIEWCIYNRIQIINMSFGMRKSSRPLHDAIRRAYNQGITIIASAGNDGKVRADYPARYAEVISVGAATPRHRKAPISNRGRYVDIYAPGEQIISTWLNGKYKSLTGTSMATSYVSGAAALLLARNHKLSPARMKSVLKASSTPIPRNGPLSGELNAHKAVRSIKKSRPKSSHPLRRRNAH